MVSDLSGSMTSLARLEEVSTLRAGLGSKAKHLLPHKSRVDNIAKMGIKLSDNEGDSPHSEYCSVNDMDDCSDVEKVQLRAIAS